MALRFACSPKLWILRYPRYSCKKDASFRLVSTRFGSLNVSEEVKEAVQSKKPVVALETTIYTHGFPYPENIALSSRLESIVRQNGGIPATIGVLNGVAKVGFQAEELIELLSTAGSPTTVKVSRRDLGLVCGRSANGKKLNGGTTIAGTMVLAHLAGIHVFATGGLGGVHRGGENSLDISADLTELGRTPVALISSGCKSFLDLPRTLEYLETQGVSVSTFADGREGQVNFPAFWTRDSGVPSPATVKNEQEAAAIIDTHLSFPLTSGMLFANPIPAESSLERSRMDEVTAEAIQQAHNNGAIGSENTPFILKYIREATKGATVTANIALVEANVKRGTLVATELAKLRLRHHSVPSRNIVMNQQQRSEFSTTAQIQNRDGRIVPQVMYRNQLRHRLTDGVALDIQQRATIDVMLNSQKDLDVVVAGSVAIDFSCDYKPLTPAQAATPAREPNSTHDQERPPTTLKLATSNPATIRSSIGGVGHNVALALHYLDLSHCFYSAVGKDLAGRSIIDAFEARGMSTNGIQRYSAHRTAQYIAFNNTDKSLFTAVADMNIFENDIEKSQFFETWHPFWWWQRPKFIVVDGNWHPNTLELWTELATSSSFKARIIFEPVSVEKSVRAFPSITSKKLLRRKSLFEITTPNEHELNAMFEYVTSPRYVEAIARATEEHEGFPPDRPSIEDMMLAFHQSVAKCLSRPGQHYGPRLGEVHNAAAKAIYLLRYFRTILVKFGSSGILQVETIFQGDRRFNPSEIQSFQIKARDIPTRYHLAGSAQGIYLRWHPPAAIVTPEKIVSVNGVGDTFLGVLVAGLARTEQPIEDLIHVAQLGAIMTLKSEESVSEEIRKLKSMIGGIADLEWNPSKLRKIEHGFEDQEWHPSKLRTVKYNNDKEYRTR